MTFSKLNFGGNRVFFSLFTTQNEREEKDLFPSGVRVATGNGILQLKDKGGGGALLNCIKKYRKTVESFVLQQVLWKLFEGNDFILVNSFPRV